MIRSILALCMILPTLASALPPETRTVFAMKTGILLRMHVVAQDDTEEMQRIKLCVRDAVRDAYAAAPDDSAAMLPKTLGMLPALTQAARRRAAQEGFSGCVTVAVEEQYFDERTLDGLTIPAGTYPALMIRLGAAQGHNWWGLIDPELAAQCARLDTFPAWDWSLAGLLKALFGFNWEVSVHE